MKQRGAYLGRVQVLRFIAAVSVLFAHLQHEVVSRFPDAGGFHPFTLIDGGFGVDLFFVISGFIMYHVAAGKFGQKGAARNFLIRRYLRIAPLYYLATVLMLLASATFSNAVSIPQPDLGHVLASFLFFPSLNALGEAVPVLKLGWTLNFEAYFYVVFAIALMFGQRTGLLVMTLLLGAMVALANVLPHPPTAIAFWGQSLVFEFIGGIGVAMLYHREFRLSSVGAWSVIAASVLLLSWMQNNGMAAYLPRAVYAGLPAWLIVMAVVAAPFDAHQGRLKRFLVAGGEASYAIYVIHPFGIRSGALIWNRIGLPMAPWLYVMLLMIVVITAAFAVNLLVERPLDRWLRGWLDGSRRADLIPAAPPA
jgi:peptidoglycan/LPS O-acetylase OafA/YrhL